MRQYVEISGLDEVRVSRIIDKLAKSEEGLLVWGAGTHTLHLLETTLLGRCNIVAFVDSNAKLHGKELQGLPIIAPSSLPHYKEPVLISSRVFQDDITRQITEDLNASNKLIYLY